MKNKCRILSIILTAIICCAGISNNEFNVKADDDSVLNLSAESAALIVCNNDELIYSKNAECVLPMASTTKIMTALVALESMRLDEVVEVHENAVATEGSSAYLTVGETLPMKDLIYALMLQSANDAAEAIAYAVAGGIDEFASLMNDKAKSLGLLATNFANPHGLDSDGHYTTAADLAKLATYAMKNAAFREIVSTERYVTENGRVFVNHNKLLKLYDGAVGVKTGYTKTSGRCLVSAAERDGIVAVAVTLNAPDDWNDHIKLLDYCFSNYEMVTLAEIGQFSVDIPCISGDQATVRCSNNEALEMCLPMDSLVSTTIEADRYFPAPIKKDDALATAKFYSEGELIASIPLYAEHEVNLKNGKLSLIDRILKLIGK